MKALRTYLLLVLLGLILGRATVVTATEGPWPHTPPSPPHPPALERISPAGAAPARTQDLFDFDPSTVQRATYPNHPDLGLWLDKDLWSGYWQCNNAFAGLPDERLETLFNLPALGNLPDALQFTYNIPNGKLFPVAHQVTPLNVGSDATLTWTVATEGHWFTATPPTGVAPASFQIIPSTFATGTVATHTGAVTVTVVDPSGAENSPHRIDLTLQVVDTPLTTIHLPLILRNHTQTSSPSSSRYPNDPGYTQQWALDKVDAPAAWSISTGSDVLIAVLDTGTDLDHPDLVSKVRTDVDWDFANDDPVADDDHGHGTHVSGIVAAATDNDRGIAGMDWEGTVLPLKVLLANGSGSTSDLAEAIRYAADHGTDVINMSLGGASEDGCPTYVQAAVDYAHAKGVVLVAAAGNHVGSEPNTEMCPANCNHVLGVAATERDDAVASYSNYGTHVSIAAPGSEIYSTIKDGEYGNKWGTSMASPYVAGLAGLLHARFPSYTVDQIASAILDNADDLGAAGWDSSTGCGRINAFQALSSGAHGGSPVCLEGIEPQSQEKTTAQAATTAPFVPGEVIVSFVPEQGESLLHEGKQSDSSRAQAEMESILAQVGGDLEFAPGLDAWRLRVPPGQERDILSILRANPAIAHANLNYLVYAQ